MPTVSFLSHPVSAGFPSPAADYLEQSLDLHRYLITNTPATVLARVRGDSMTQAGIYDQDIVIVDRSLTPVPDQLVVAALDGGLIVKQWQQRDGRTILHSASDQYADIVLTDDSDFLLW
nr:translesion error-prone DNA polymerase V autoproteolytic subunit [Candidatus Gracilibacteria bacterium]